MKNTIKNNNTRFQRSIAAILLLCQLLASCGGSGEEIGPNFQAPEPLSAGALLEPEASSVAAAFPSPVIEAGALPAPTPGVESEDAAAAVAPAVGVDASLPLLGNLAAGEVVAIQTIDMQRIGYRTMAGKSEFIEVDLSTITVGGFREAISRQKNLSIQDFELSYEIHPLEESNDAAGLKEFVGGEIAESFIIVYLLNSAIAKKMLGANYVGEEAWQQLGIPEEGQEAIELPILSDAMLAEIKRLQTKGEQPILVLDLGKSIEEMESLCKAKGVNVLKADGDDEKLRAEDCYRAPGTGSRWLLLPGSDHGVLPGSRDKTYADPVTYMNSNYGGYEVGGARELVTIAMLKFLQDGTVLFPSEPWTYGRCKEQFQKAGRGWDGYSICLGGVDSSSPSVFGGLVVNYQHYTRHYT